MQHVLELIFLWYFTILVSWYALSLAVSSAELARQRRSGINIGLDRVLSAGSCLPISVLAPAYNEQETIQASVNSFLALDYPQFEVIVINDGSKDSTMARLMELYDLYPVPLSPAANGVTGITTQQVRGTYRSSRQANLLVIDKDNGGKADALNVGVLHASYPLLCAVDADSLLNADALKRVARQFSHDPKLIAVGGTVHAMNGAVFKGGRVSELRMPDTWAERFQVVEYLRAFLLGRAAFSSFGVLLIISGAFGVFRNAPVVAVGGYRTDTVGEDMDLIVRLHAYAREQNRDLNVAYSIDAVCWTQTPDSFQVLGRQRNRWQRGLLETLLHNRRMLFNPRYGKVGLLGLPYFLVFEALPPIIEVGGLLFTLITLLLGVVNEVFAITYLFLSIMSGLLASLTSMNLEVFLPLRYEQRRDRWLLILTAVIENFGYRQWQSYVRLSGTLNLFKQKGTWGQITRKAIYTQPDQGLPDLPAHSAHPPPTAPRMTETSRVSATD